MFKPAWKEVCGLDGVAAEVRDVKTVMDALRMDVSWDVVDCEDGTAEARLVIWDTIPSTDRLLPDPAIPLTVRTINRMKMNTSPLRPDLLPVFGRVPIRDSQVPLLRDLVLRHRRDQDA